MSGPSPRVAAQLDGLAELCAQFAAQQLDRHGEFYPFAVGVLGGELRMVAANTDEHQPTAETVISLLAQGLAQQATEGTIEGCAIATDVRVQSGDRDFDALRVDVEHRDFSAVTVILGYHTGPDGTSFDDPITEPGTARVFGVD